MVGRAIQVVEKSTWRPTSRQLTSRRFFGRVMTSPTVEAFRQKILEQVYSLSDIFQRAWTFLVVEVSHCSRRVFIPHRRWVHRVGALDERDKTRSRHAWSEFRRAFRVVGRIGGPDHLLAGISARLAVAVAAAERVVAFHRRRSWQRRCRRCCLHDHLHSGHRKTAAAARNCS